MFKEYPHNKEKKERGMSLFGIIIFAGIIALALVLTGQNRKK